MSSRKYFFHAWRFFALAVFPMTIKIQVTIIHWQQVGLLCAALGLSMTYAKRVPERIFIQGNTGATKEDSVWPRYAASIPYGMLPVITHGADIWRTTKKLKKNYATPNKISMNNVIATLRYHTSILTLAHQAAIRHPGHCPNIGSRRMSSTQRRCAQTLGTRAVIGRVGHTGAELCGLEGSWQERYNQLHGVQP